MALFDQLGQQELPSKEQMNNLATQLRSNPVGFLQKMGYNIPNGLDLRNPNGIINYLLQTRQINGGLLGIAQQVMGMFR